MKYFLDTEFIEDGKTIDLISIGIACEDGREFYRCSTECGLTKADDWVRQNVLVHLPRYSDAAWANRATIKAQLIEFIHDDMMYGTNVQFWAYYADYDWIALCQLFGRMIDLPSRMPMYCNDIKQMYESLGGKEKVGHLKPPDPVDAHDALSDAKWNKQFYDALVAYRQPSGIIGV
jgi:3' exoribonuclease, RNase T-like